MSPPDTDISTPAARNVTAFDPLTVLDDLLSDVGLSRAETGGRVSFAGQDPILPAAHRLGACIGIPIMAAAVAAVAIHRHRGGPGQDLELDLRQAVHGITPGAFWHPTLNGELAPHPLVLDNPFLLTPYRTADGRRVMASGVYPHLAAKWCRFLDVPPDAAKVAAAIQRWDAFELEEAANAAGLRHPGLVHVSVTCYGSSGPWAERGGFDMNGSAASGLMTMEGSAAEPRLPVTGMINDYITGYLGAAGASAALVKRATEGGSWHVTVSLTRTAMWCGSLGLVNPALAGCDDEHRLREPVPYDAPSLLGDVHMLAPPVRFSSTAPAWPTPLLVPRGSGRAEWRN